MTSQGLNYYQQEMKARAKLARWECRVSAIMAAILFVALLFVIRVAVVGFSGNTLFSGVGPDKIDCLESSHVTEIVP